MKKGGENVLKT